MTGPRHCLVLGSSGWLGSLLLERLLAAGHRVSALVRTPGKEPADPRIRVVPGDATDPAAVRTAMSGVDVVYHLVHSLDRDDFAAIDRRCAHVVAAEAERAGVSQLVYLGGTRPDDGRTVSAHLASRAEVGDILLDGAVPALVLQAAMVIGAGSASFELLRTVTRLAPVLPRPGWMNRHSRPIAVADVLHYLTAAAESAEPARGRADLAGPESISYLDLLRRSARVAGLPVRLPVPTPIWSHGLAARAAGLLSPVSAAVAGPLLESLEHDLGAEPVPAERFLPAPPNGPTGLDRALRAAYRDGAELPDPVSTRGSYVDSRTVACAAGPDALWRVITGIGGDAGWHTLPGVWQVRGLLDQALGGAGLYRGRPAELHAGDVVDFWTVRERDDAARRLVLRADMRMPGRTELSMSAEPAPDGGSRYRQRITFAPHGLAGRLYWTLQKPAHDVVFGVMAAALPRTATRD